MTRDDELLREAFAQKAACYAEGTALGSCAPGPKPAPELMLAIGEIQSTHKMALEASAALSEFIGRLNGQERGEGGNTTRPAFSGGLVGDLRRTIDNTSETLLGILEMTRTLRTIA